MALPPLPDLMSESSGRQRSRPTFTPEQQESILSRALSGIMSGVEWVGESLGKPGRTVRALAYDQGGPELSDLAHLIPFSDTLGWTNPDDVPSGGDLRERWGMTSNTGNPWVDVPLNLVTDVGIEVLHDPLTLVTGPGKALTKLGVEAVEQGSRVARAASFADEIANAGKNAMLGTSPARYADEIRAGQRGLIGIKIPFAEHPLFTFGAGSETAAKAADLLYYSPLSPMPYIRQLLDKRVGGHGPRYQRELGDLVHSKTLETSAQIIDKSLAIDKRLGELGDTYDHTLKVWLGQNPQAAKQLTGGAPLDAMNPNALVRSIAELKGTGQNMQAIVQNASRLAGTQAPDAVMQAASAFDEVAQAAIKTKDDVFRVYTGLGGDVTALDDKFIAHFPRRLSELMAAQMGKGKANRAAKDVWGAIQRNIRDIDGGTYKVNAMSMDPNVTGWWDDVPDPAIRQAKLQQSEAILAQKYGLPRAKPVLKNGQPVVQNGKPVTENVAAEFAGYLARLPKDVTAEGLFSRSLTTDMVDYSLNMMRRANGLQAVHGLTLAAASDDVTIGPTVKELMDELKVNDTGVQHFIGEYATKNGLNPADVDPTALYVPEAARKAAERMLHYNSKPQDIIGPLKLIDNVLGLHKAGLYAPWVASHTRNAISGLWQNLVTAFRNPADAVFGIKEAQAAMKGAGNREWLEAFKAYALHNGLQIDDWLEVAKAQASEIPTGIGSTLLSAGKDYTWGTVKNVGSTLKSLTAPKETLKKLASSDGFREAVAEFGPFKGGRKLGDLVEFVNRYSHFVALKKRGWTNAAAARSVKLAHFDYSPQALTPFENQFMKRLVPFYRFARGNLPLQLRSLIDEPGGRTAQTIRAINLGREQAREEGGYVPSYLSEGLAVPFGPTVDGMRTYGVSSEVLPVEEAFNRFPFFDNSPDAKLTAENLGAMVNPLLSTPLQLMSGRQWWSHRDIDDLYQDPTSDQNLNFLLANTPAARGLSTSRMLQDPRKTDLQKLINATIGGARFTTVDIPKWMNIESREVLERMLEPSAGVLEGQYLFAPDPSQLTEEQIIQLSILQALNAENRKLNKERKAREKR
jgi:hypothetical protein